MTKPFSLQTIVRMVPNTLLQEFFQQLKLDTGVIAWASLTKREIDPINPSSSNPSSSNPSSSSPSSSTPSSSNPFGSSSSYSGCCCEYYFEVDRNGPTPPNEADIQLLSSTPYQPGTPNTGCLDPAWEAGCPEWSGLAALMEDMALHISDPKYDFHGAYGFLSVDVCNGVIVQINSGG